MNPLCFMKDSNIRLWLRRWYLRKGARGAILGRYAPHPFTGYNVSPRIIS